MESKLNLGAIINFRKFGKIEKRRSLVDLRPFDWLGSKTIEQCIDANEFRGLLVGYYDEM